MTTRAILALIAATSALSGVLSAPALAGDDWYDGLYVGANVGKVLDSFRRTDIDEGLTAQFSGANDGFTMGPSSVRKSHALWAVDLGYMLSPNIGFEADYIDLGKLKYSGYGTVSSDLTSNGLTSIEVDLDIKSHGPALALVGVLPMSNWWELDAHAGAMQAKTTTDYVSAVATGNTSSGTESKTSTAALLGAGTGIMLSTHWILRLDYLRLQKLDEPVLGRSFSVDLVTLGANFVF